MQLGNVRGLWLALVVLGHPGCIIDGDKCDAHQVERNEGSFSLCVCESNAVINPKGYGCTPCGEHEEPKDNLCVCKAGFTKPSPDARCEESEIGAPCQDGEECSEAFPFCVGADVGAGYCTSAGCADNAACPSGYTCEASESGPFCRKLPTGIGAPCESEADCAPFDAKLCNTLTTKTCVLAGCADGSVTCPSEWTCCDFSALFPVSACAPPEQLSNGMCPMGGVAVTR